MKRQRLAEAKPLRTKLTNKVLFLIVNAPRVKLQRPLLAEPLAAGGMWAGEGLEALVDGHVVLQHVRPHGERLGTNLAAAVVSVVDFVALPSSSA